MNNILATDIINSVQADRLHLNWTQNRHQNFYIGDVQTVIIGNDEHLIQPVKSYETVVGFYNLSNDVFYEVGKYSRTTSKQITQYCNQRSCKREYLDRFY